MLGAYVILYSNILNMVVLGLLMMAGQVLGIVKAFDGGNNRPKWLDIVVGIMLCFMFLAIIGAYMD